MIVGSTLTDKADLVLLDEQNCHEAYNYSLNNPKPALWLGPT